VVGLTFTPPLLPSLAASPLGPQPGQPNAVVQVLSANAPGAVQNSLGEALLDIAGPGNIITGRVTVVSADGNLTLTTETGSQISLHHPPELPLPLGSMVTLRIVSAGSTPQVVVLSVDGRPVAFRPGSTPAPPAVAVPATPAIPAGPPRVSAMPGADSASAYAASLVAILGLGDAAQAGPGGGPAAVAQGTAGPMPGEMTVLLDQILAILVQSAASRPGQTPPPVGTQYLASLASETALPVAEEALVAAAAGPAGPPIGSDADVGDPAAPEFAPLTATVPGRVLAPADDGTALIGTALGTMALQGPLPLPPGTAVRLGIFAVAPPAAGALAPLRQEAQAGLLDQIFKLLFDQAPSIAEPAAAALTLPADGTLLATAWAFMVDARRRTLVRDAATMVRQALVAADRPDLAERFESASSDLGAARPPALPDGWTLMTLPFLGLASEQPVRVYARPAGDEPDGEGHDGRTGARIVVDVSLTRLGALQFDGLVRDRRFDLIIRSPSGLDPGLRDEIDRAFQSAIAECGFAGELVYARTPPVPPWPQISAGQGVGLSV
jgi:hypothetical protein